MFLQVFYTVCGQRSPVSADFHELMLLQIQLNVPLQALFTHSGDALKVGEGTRLAVI